MGSATQHTRHLRWDLDKTYLKTDFDTFRDLVRTFRQSAAEKRSVPGAAALLRELLSSPNGDDIRRVTFISGSPRQMRKVLIEKLRLDGIEPDAFILKPNLSNLLKLRFRALRGQVGYKLRALLESRIDGPNVSEVLFGDDAERDAFIYSLYADILDGRVLEAELLSILEACEVSKSDVEPILTLRQDIVPGQIKVSRIFIHLDRRSPTARFAAYGHRVVPVYNYFQAALLLHDLDLLTRQSLQKVTGAMGDDGYTPVRLANSLQDLMRRGFLPLPLLERLGDVLDDPELRRVDGSQLFRREFRAAIRGLETIDRSAQAQPEHIDYLGLAHETKYHRKRSVIPGIRWLSG